MFQGEVGRILPRKEVGENNPYFSCSVVPILTPLLDFNGKLVVDTESLDNLIKNLADKGSTGVFSLGTVGEFRTLDKEQKLTVVSQTVNSARKVNINSVIGVSGNNLREIEAIAGYAGHIGATGVALVPLYGEDDPTDKLNVVKKAFQGPVILYNNPGIHTGEYRGLDLPLSFIELSMKDKQVVGIKNTSTPQFTQEILNSRQIINPDYAVLEGNIRAMNSSLINGADGVVCVYANTNPAEISNMCAKKGREGYETLTALTDLHQTTKQLKTVLVRDGIFSTDLMSSPDPIRFV